MRHGCYDCVRKHLGEAAIFETEIGLGYPDFDIYVIGCLSHASQEAEAVNPELARCIRDWRIRYMEDPSKTTVPYEAFSVYIKLCVLAESDGLEYPKLGSNLKVPAPSDPA